MLAQPLSVLALGLLLLLVLLKLQRLHLSGAPVAGERIVADGQCPQISRVRVSGDERV